MKRFSWIISIYIIRAIMPYFGFAWLFLSVILFVQQGSRHSDILFSSSLPSSLVWQLTLALVPNVIAFTCPMAILIGVIIGLSKMQGDSELIAIRAAGIGNLQITLPVALFGMALSLFALFINLKGVPLASQIVRKVVLQAAIYKLESPIEPGVFNSEIQGYTIYVKDGDLKEGIWKNIFIYQQDKETKQVRLITSNKGRIDSRINDSEPSETAENSELVLEDATINTFSLEDLQQKLVLEKVAELRVVIKTKRGELLERLAKTDETPDEMGLNELSQYAKSKTGKERTEAEILWQRRINLIIAPFIFSILGVSLVLRFNRRGRGFGIVLALIGLITYYLITLLMEQLAQTNKISVPISGIIPLLIAAFAIAWFFVSERFFLANAGKFLRNNDQGRQSEVRKGSRGDVFSNWSTGILDFDIVSTLLKYFLLTLISLTSIYLIFTAFGLWKFAGKIENGFALLMKYLFYLLPFIYIQISPSCLMVAILATYVIKSRQNEVVTWTASGQSIYRLLRPCFVLMLLVGMANWTLQEKLLAATNLAQDSLRTKIRNNGVAVSNTFKHWLATENRVYSFDLADGGATSTGVQKIKNLSVYQFAFGENRLQSVTRAEHASWEDNQVKFSGNKEQIIWEGGNPRVVPYSQIESEVVEPYNPFKKIQRKPNHLTTAELKEFIKTTDSESEHRSYSIALQKRYSILFLPIVIGLFTAPFALTLSRRGNVVSVGYAVIVWLVFMAVSNVLEQYGLSGTLETGVAVWAPLVVFTCIGGFLLARVRT